MKIRRALQAMQLLLETRMTLLAVSAKTKLSPPTLSRLRKAYNTVPESFVQKLKSAIDPEPLLSTDELGVVKMELTSKMPAPTNKEPLLDIIRRALPHKTHVPDVRLLKNIVEKLQLKKRKPRRGSNRLYRMNMKRSRMTPKKRMLRRERSKISRTT